MVREGHSALLVADIAGASLAYQWYFNGKRLEGANSAVLQLRSLSIAQAGSYLLEARNSAGAARTRAAAVEVQHRPYLDVTPTSVRAAKGKSVTFRVSAKGTPNSLNYAWYHDQRIIGGANGPALTIVNAKPRDSGSYHVIVSNSIGSSTSPAAKLSFGQLDIGVVHVIDPGYKLTDFKACYADTGNGYSWRGVWRGCGRSSGFPWGSTKHLAIPLPSLVTANTTRTVQVSMTDGSVERLTHRSLAQVADYWHGLLAKHQIKQTTLGASPHFVLHHLPIVQHADTIPSTGGGIDARYISNIKSFFGDVVTKQRIDLSTYDYVVYIQYQANVCYFTNADLGPPGCKGFYRFNVSFADPAGRATYMSVPLGHSSAFRNNDVFITLAHELGHTLFNLPDLYTGLTSAYGQYPAGAAEWDTRRWPTSRACLMTKRFAKAIDPADTSRFLSWRPELPGEPSPPAGTSRLLVGDADRYELCRTSQYAIAGLGPPATDLSFMPKLQPIEVDEGNGPLRLTITLANAHPSKPVRYRIWTNTARRHWRPSATQGVDASFSSTDITFPAGQARLTINQPVQIVDDAGVEPDEVLALYMQALDDKGALTGNPHSTTITIIDND